MTRWPSLDTDELRAFWPAVSERLARRGANTRGRMHVESVGEDGLHVLRLLVNGPVRATIDLASLERALCELGVGPTLPDALATLGYHVSDEPARRRAKSTARSAARDLLREVAAEWAEPWVTDWTEEMVRSGVPGRLGVAGTLDLARRVRSTLDRLASVHTTDRADELSRTELAATLFGDAHALDRGTTLEGAVSRSLRLEFPGLNYREMWAHAGAQLDLVSGPALVWGLPVVRSQLAPMCQQATELGIPLHLSQFALRRFPVEVARGAWILVAENPRVVEAAAQARSPVAVICANGNPSGAVHLLVEQLLVGGGALRYHGDFDAAGLAICARMVALGLKPWHMDATSYQRAIAAAAHAGEELPIDMSIVPPTQWDPDLHDLFARERRVVHEERVLNDILRGK
jgi:uncharacterized protein (TIGR02679 family)